jgi:hypothetical protein
VVYRPTASQEPFRRLPTPTKLNFDCAAEPVISSEQVRMLKQALLLIALVASCNAIWLYSADVYNLSYNLYAIDTTTYTVYTVGKIRDADGDFFTPIGMSYDNVTGLIYAVTGGRASNTTKRRGILAINPQTAQGALFYFEE